MHQQCGNQSFEPSNAIYSLGFLADCDEQFLCNPCSYFRPDNQDLRPLTLKNSEETLKNDCCLDLFRIGWGFLLYKIDGLFVVTSHPDVRIPATVRSVDCTSDIVHCITESGQYQQVHLDGKHGIKDSQQRWHGVCCDNNHVVLLDADGMGHLYSPSSITPLGISVRAVSCGHEHVIILDERGRVLTMGRGSRAQLGHGDLEDCAQPRPVDDLDGLKCDKIAAGGWHSAAVTDCGDLFVWGWNQSGQLGILSSESHHHSSSPRSNHPHDSTNSKERECDHGDEATLTRTSGSGTTSHVSGEDLNSDGQKMMVDQGPVSMLAEPTLVELDGGKPVVDVACGSRHTVAVTADQKLFVWGWNKYGQLGVDHSVTSQSGRGLHQNITSEGGARHDGDSVWTPTLHLGFQDRGLAVAGVRAAYWTTLVQVQTVT